MNWWKNSTIALLIMLCVCIPITYLALWKASQPKMIAIEEINIQKHSFDVAYDKLYQEYVGQYITLEHIKSNVINALYITKYNRTKELSQNQFETLCKILYIGEKEFSISHMDVCAIIMNESEFNWNCKSKVNKNGTRDYSLTQQNSEYLKIRYEAASTILDQNNISYCIDDKYDVGLNTMSCIMFLKNIRDTVYYPHNRSTLYSLQQQKIVAYNVGINGSRIAKMQSIGLGYWNRFKNYKQQLVSCDISDHFKSFFDNYELTVR